MESWCCSTIVICTHYPVRGSTSGATDYTCGCLCIALNTASNRVGSWSFGATLSLLHIMLCVVVYLLMIYIVVYFVIVLEIIMVVQDGLLVLLYNVGYTLYSSW